MTNPAATPPPPVPALSVLEQDRWQDLPKLLHRVVQAQVASMADPDSAALLRRAVRAGLRAWDEASVDWRAAITAVDVGPNAFVEWVSQEARFRLFQESREEWTQADGQQLARLQGPVWVEDEFRVSATLAETLVHHGLVRHYAAWVQSGWLWPDPDLVEHLLRQHGLHETLAEQQRRQQVQWLQALGEGRLIEWMPVTLRRVPTLQR